MTTERAFKTEAALCAAFIAWATAGQAVTCYAEWAGWDILLVYPDGAQVGIQAKLRLNPDVLLQAAPSPWADELGRPGLDFRAVLVPERKPKGMSALAHQLGLVVFHGWEEEWRRQHRFSPSLDGRHHHGEPWVDWNPPARHELPPVASTDAVAGSSAPILLTPWKLKALAVLAELATAGSITARRMREMGIHAGRWTTGRWLEPGPERGLWVRGERCPKFDEQHPTAYAAALARAKGAE